MGSVGDTPTIAGSRKNGPRFARVTLRCKTTTESLEGMRVEIVRRLGRTPQERGSLNNGTCPDIFELDDGRFAVIGTDLTEDLDGKLPPGSARADYERIVVITRETLVYAKGDIPAEAV